MGNFLCTHKASFAMWLMCGFSWATFGLGPTSLNLTLAALAVTVLVCVVEAENAYDVDLGDEE